MNDSDLQTSVTAELNWDPKIDGDDIAVFADGGVVALRGTVTSLAQRHRAEQAARRVGGCSGIHNQLLVRVLPSGSRADDGLRPDVLQAFRLDRLIPRQRARPGR